MLYCSEQSTDLNASHLCQHENNAEEVNQLTLLCLFGDLVWPNSLILCLHCSLRFASLIILSAAPVFIRHVAWSVSIIVGPTIIWILYADYKEEATSSSGTFNSRLSTRRLPPALSWRSWYLDWALYQFHKYAFESLLAWLFVYSFERWSSKSTYPTVVVQYSLYMGSFSAMFRDLQVYACFEFFCRVDYSHRPPLSNSLSVMKLCLIMHRWFRRCSNQWFTV